MRPIIYGGLLAALLALAGFTYLVEEQLQGVSFQSEQHEAATGWMVVQARLEVDRFLTALATRIAGDPKTSEDDVRLRLDILWSRAPVLNTEMALPIEADGLTLPAAAARIQDVLTKVDARLAGHPIAPGDLELLRDVRSLLAPAVNDLQALLLAFQLAQHRINDQARDEIASVVHRSEEIHFGFLTVAGLLLTLALVETVFARRSERTAIASTERFRHFAEAASDYLWELDANLNVRFVSDRYLATFGLSVEEVVGRPWTQAVTFSEESPEWREQRQRLIEHRPFRDFVFSQRDGGGAERIIQASGTPFHDPSGRFIGYRGVASDITERLTQENRIKYLAEHDTLSGLLNAGAFQEALHRALAAAARDGKELAVLVADLDDFKEINDTFGHYAGDVVLREVGERIRRAIGREDVAARCGGDEFAIALSVDASAAARAEEVAKTILAAVNETIEVDGQEIRIGISVGIATYPEHGLESDALVSMADLALYSAKREGRGRFRFFVTALGDSVRWRRQVERELRGAVAEKTIEIAYQPLIRIADRRLMGAEALARWHSPELGIVSPATFIPIAEQTGIIVPLGRLILERACRDAAGWTGALAEMPVSVNVSPVQFQRDDLVDRVREALSASGLAPARLVLEITESLLLELDEQRGTLGVLDELRQLGVKIALDDFGVGYSNLSRLRRLPIQRLKIDRTFLRDIEQDGQQRRVLHTMVMLGQSLGVETTAEGVETEAQLNLLAEIGCYQAQGYLFGLPMPARELADLAARWLPSGGAMAPVRLAS